MSETGKRAIRTLIQLIAGGGLYALTEQIKSDLPASWGPYIVAFYTILVVVAMNECEERGWIPALLKGPSGSNKAG